MSDVFATTTFAFTDADGFPTPFLDQVIAAPLPGPGRPKGNIPTKEYVSGGARRWWATALENLIRDANGQPAIELGPAVYRRMMKDAKVRGSVQTVKQSIFSEDMRLDAAFHPPVLPDGSPDPGNVEATRDAERAAEVLDYDRWLLDRLERPLDEVLDELFDGIAYRVKAAELVYDVPEDGPHAGYTCLKEVKVRPNRCWAFAVDEHDSVVGLVGMTADGQTVMLPQVKYCYLSWMTRDNDPRGQSSLDAAYVPWNIKTLAWPAYYLFSTQFSSPSLDAELPENAQPVPALDPDGNEIPGQTISAAEAFYDELAAFQNATVLVRPAGSKLNVLEPRSGGEVFDRIFDRCDREIVYAIQQQTRTSMEAQFGSKADSGTAQDVLGLLSRYGRRKACRLVRDQILWAANLLRFDKETADRYTPRVLLGVTDHQDYNALLSALALLFQSGAYAESQFRPFMRMLNLPEPAEGSLTLKGQQLQVGIKAQQQGMDLADRDQQLKERQADLQEEMARHQMEMQRQAAMQPQPQPANPRPAPK